MKEDKQNKNNRYPLWFLKCNCVACKKLRNSLGMNGDSELIKEHKERPGFNFNW